MDPGSLEDSSKGVFVVSSFGGSAQHMSLGSIVLVTNWVAMAHHGLLMGGNESYGLQEAFRGRPHLGEAIKKKRKLKKSRFQGSAHGCSH